MNKGKKIKRISFFMALVMCIGLILPYNAKASEEVKGEEKVIDILSFNDFHGNLNESGKNVGAAKLTGEIKKIKKENPNTMVVSAGDLYQGTAMSNLTKGDPVSEMLKSMNIEASAIGNHEFDWGYNLISKWAKEGNFDFLATNIYDKNTNKPVEWAKPYKVVEKDGVKIGFIGLSTPETAFKTKPDNVKNFEFKNPSEAAKTWVKHLKEVEKVNAIVALTHIGSFQDKNGVITGEAEELVKNVPGLNAVISSHTHQYVNGRVNNVPVVQAMNNGRGLARLTFTFNKDGSIKDVKNNVDKLYERKDLVEDQGVKAMVKGYEEKLKPILSEVITNIDSDLPHDRYIGLSPLGQFTTKYMAKAGGVQIGITNGGGLRVPLTKGEITVGNLYEVMPFDNTLVTMKLKGSDLKRVLENGIDNKEVGWVQFYGLRVFYDKEAPFGNKITSMRLLDGTKVENDKYYTVATNDFMMDKGDKYDFTGAIEVSDTMEPLRDLVAVELKKEKNIHFEFDGNTLVSGVDNIKDEDTSIPVSENKDTDNKEVLPQTGNDLGYDDFMVIGSMMIVVGVFLARKKKNQVA
ncbi:5'-nucleotidase C-terminal domain-containing protein [Clostridium hydrogeniformans]|uniref:5'-nucleotidase C-terminal domain-containing protein n=1 Tax=Clostridium hydrogeniformans TaxID=349933 RepID=UPI00068CCE11|nr:5'-nucleotidase C-terminal domain-containing protein [Clostridium hydrogeniformans]